MSEHNVEIVRRCLEAYGRGDNEAALAAFDPAVAYDLSAYTVPRVFGHDGVIETMRSYTGAFEDLRIEVDEVVEGRDCVYVAHTQRGRGKGSGIEIAQTYHQVVTLRNGKIVHWQAFSSREGALEASGLSAAGDSDQNTEIARRLFADWAEGRFWAVDVVDPDVRFEAWMPDASENLRAQGLEEISVFLRDWFLQWRDYRLVAEEFRAVGDDTVFVTCRQAAHGRKSGAEVVSSIFVILRLRRRKIVELAFHYDREMALGAVGLKD